MSSSKGISKSGGILKSREALAPTESSGTIRKLAASGPANPQLNVEPASSSLTRKDVTAPVLCSKKLSPVSPRSTGKRFAIPSTLCSGSSMICTAAGNSSTTGSPSSARIMVESKPVTLMPSASISPATTVYSKRKVVSELPVMSYIATRVPSPMTSETPGLIPKGTSTGLLKSTSTLISSPVA